MPNKVKVIVLRTAGTNCDQESAFAFTSFGAQADLVHINKLYSKEVSLKDYHIFVLPGGFSYGDNIESGRILANELRIHLGDDITKFIKDGKLIIGICNGFQILVKAGILPGGAPLKADELSQTSTLINNDSGKFEDRWVHLKTSGKCVWTSKIDAQVFYPVAHAEGKFVADKATRTKLAKNNQIVFSYSAKDGGTPKYPENPNGSLNHIAGITDKTGRVLGLMPHPERHFLFTQHPFWTRLSKKEKYGEGAQIFKNGVDYVKKNLL